MEVNALVVGYGSAGKRHAKIARDLDVDVTTVDPFAPADSDDMIAALETNDFEIVVIASPPKFHIGQIAVALDYGAYVMCEKPLCDIGQIEHAEAIAEHPDADRVMVTYNYRYHRMLSHGKLQNSKPVANWWYLSCYQYRPQIPEWGLLLDHVSHDLDIISWKSRMSLNVEHVEHSDDGIYERYVVDGTVGDNDRFEIDECVNKLDANARRSVIYSSPNGWTHIPADQRMYDDMWMKFLANLYAGYSTEPGLYSALQTQYLLEQAHKIEMEGIVQK